MHEGGQNLLEDAPPGARCAVHEQATATVVCSRCGNYCCPDCGVLFGTRYLCRSCFEIERAKSHYGEASKRQRLVNFVIDSICVRTGSFLIGFWFRLIGLPSAAVFVPGVLVTLAYYMVLEGTWQISVGKIVSKTKVVTVTGEVPTFRHIFLRSLIRLVPLDWLSFLFGERGWHDNWSGTRVVSTTAPNWMKDV